MTQTSPPNLPVSTWHTLAAGLTAGLVAIVQSVGMGSLLAASAPQFASVFIGMALFSSAVVGAITPLFSASPLVIATTQGVSTVALAAMVRAVAAGTGGLAPGAALTTLTAAIALATITTALSALLLGVFRLGRFIRFAPFPVIAGFLAGSGWLVLRGGLDVIAGRPIMDGLLHPDYGLLVKLAAGTAFIVVVVGLERATKVRVVLPTAVAAALALFNASAAIGHLSPDTLRAAGWLIALPGATHLWPPVAPGDIASVDWRAILPALEYLPSAIVLTIVALLMNATSIELAEKRDLDLDNELRTVGAANILAGMGGGLPGFHSLSLTFLANRLGARSRLTGLIVALTCVAALVLGTGMLSIVPTPLLGAMLLWTGATLLIEWGFRSYARLSRWEYAIVVLIFLAIAVTGFAWGLFVGIVAALLLFVVEYGRVDIVRMLVTGRDYQSSVDVSEEREQTLQRHGNAILIMRLQGFLFFGTAERLRQRVESKAATPDEGRADFIVIDFRRVTGIDSSTVLSFIRLSQTAIRENFTIALTGVAEATRASMLRGGLELDEGAPIRFFPDFDAGLKWCEDELLAHAAPGYVANALRPLGERLTGILRDEKLAATVAAYCERMEVAAGERLIEQGTPSADIFFIEAGHAAVAIVSPGHAPIRLATIGPGAIVGEVAFYLGEERSASVIAEQDLIAWRLSRTSMDRLQ
ncbi:MAG TPA: SulP family inorganic anion transporter, partial [Bauldia sp.]|nr:SulP family inorganic anion transporter [Bauldia sp.]